MNKKQVEKCRAKAFLLLKELLAIKNPSQNVQDATNFTRNATFFLTNALEQDSFKRSSEK